MSNSKEDETEIEAQGSETEEEELSEYERNKRKERKERKSSKKHKHKTKHKKDSRQQELVFKPSVTQVRVPSPEPILSPPSPMAERPPASRPPASKPAANVKKERPFVPLDQYEQTRLAAIDASAAKKTKKEKDRPFNIAVTMKDLIHVKFMRWLSNNSRELHDKNRIEMIIVDDEAIAFHTWHENRTSTIKPFNLLLYYVPTEEDRKKEANPRTREAYTQLKQSERIVTGNNIAAHLVNTLNAYIAELPSSIQNQLQQRCKCTLGKPGEPFFSVEPIPSKYQYNIVYNERFQEPGQEPEDNSITLISMRFWYDQATQGPPPHFLVHESRLYGTLGYLVQRAEILKRIRVTDGDTQNIQEDYNLQYKKLIKLLDTGIYSCESISAAARACIGRTATRMDPTQRDSRYQEAQTRINNPQTLVDQLIATGYYPASEGPKILQAIIQNKIDVESLATELERLKLDFDSNRK